MHDDDLPPDHPGNTIGFRTDELGAFRVTATIRFQFWHAVVLVGLVGIVFQIGAVALAWWLLGPTAAVIAEFGVVSAFWAIGGIGLFVAIAISMTVEDREAAGGRIDGPLHQLWRKSPTMRQPGTRQRKAQRWIYAALFIAVWVAFGANAIADAWADTLRQILRDVRDTSDIDQAALASLVDAANARVKLVELYCFVPLGLLALIWLWDAATKLWHETRANQGV